MRYSSKQSSRLSLLSRLLSDNVKIWSVRVALALCLACIFAYVLNHLQLTRNISQYMEGKEQLAQLRKTNEELREDIQTLEQELAEVSNPSWVEKQARLRGMIFQGEEVYLMKEANHPGTPISPTHQQDVTP